MIAMTNGSQNPTPLSAINSKQLMDFSKPVNITSENKIISDLLFVYKVLNILATDALNIIEQLK